MNHELSQLKDNNLTYQELLNLYLVKDKTCYKPLLHLIDCV